MRWSKVAQGLAFWRRQRASAWGALPDRQEILLAALSRQQTGGVRVVGFHRLHPADGLVQPDAPGPALEQAFEQALRRLGEPLQRPGRILALALDDSRYRQGRLNLPSDLKPAQLAAEVMLEAAGLWGVPASQVSFDFGQPQAGSDGRMVIPWASCLRQELLHWQTHVRNAGWQLPAVETEAQALERAALCWLGDDAQRWVEAPQDWRFATAAQRARTDLDWQRLSGWPLRKPLAACGAALGALL